MNHWCFPPTGPPLNQRDSCHFRQNIPPAPHKIHSKELLLVIQHSYNPEFIPFQTLIIGLVNHIKLYHGVQPITREVSGHESK